MMAGRIMKNFHFSSVAIVLPLLLAPGIASAAPILHVDAPVAASSGDTVLVEVNVSGVSDLYAFQFNLGFDPNILAAATITEGSFLPSGGATFLVSGTIDNIGGTITDTADTLLTAISGVSGSGTLIAFGFIALGSGVSPIVISSPILLDANFNGLDATLSNGSIAVSSVPEPSSLTLGGVALVRLLIARRRAIAPNDGGRAAGRTGEVLPA